MTLLGNMENGNFSESEDSDSGSDISSSSMILSNSGWNHYSLYIQKFPFSPLFDRESLMEDHLFCERKYQEIENVPPLDYCWLPDDTDSLPLYPMSPSNSGASKESFQSGGEGMGEVGSFSSGVKRKLSLDSDSQEFRPNVELATGSRNSNRPGDSFNILQDSVAIVKFNAYYTSTLPLSAGEEYYKWKSYIRNFFNQPTSGLTAGFKVDLKTLKDSKYAIGASADCRQVINRSDKGCPSCPDVLGEITLPDDEDA
ncbi:hypothetical protein HDV06_003313, partial [Boothiomyces sp. JEL0866]